MKTIKNRLFLATAILALASCADNTYLGDQEVNNTGNGGKIIFGSSTPSLTRAERTGATAAEDLGYKFKVYATKTISSTPSNVFATGTFSSDANYNADPDAYWVWYNASTANTTTSNTADWDYVGAAGTHGKTGYEVTIDNGKDQTIKYWDTNADKYEFVAYSATVSGATISKYQTSGFTVAATPTQLAGLYIADKKEIAKNSAEFAHEVKFTFRRAASKVRLGIYETVPGYDVKNVTFHYNDGAAKTSTSNAYLTGSFIGSSTSPATYNVTYSGTTPQKAILTPSSSSNNTSYFDFGTFNSSTSIGTSSTSPTWANPSTDNYTNVLPNISNVGAMTLTIDYTLINTVSGETINITGATATVPAKYMTWNPNFAYTYLFKITDDKLTPITFDAVTIDDGEGKQETITTVTDPSITTYAKASNVTTDGDYKDGATIYATVWDNALTTPGLVTLSNSNIKLYTVASSDANNFPITEASVLDAILKNPTLSTAEATAAKITYADGPTVTYGKTVTDYYNNTIELDNTNNVVASFTGNKTGSDPTFYAIVYTKTAATYTVDNGNTYENETAFNAAGTLYTDNTCGTVATWADNTTTYYKRTAVASTGTYAVKIIKVVP